MNYEYCITEPSITEALDIVSSWEVREEDFARVLIHLMCDKNLEPSSDLPLCSPYAALRF